MPKAANAASGHGVLTPENSQLLMAGFAPSVGVGVNLVNMCTDALYNQIFKRIGFDLNTIWISFILFSILFGCIVFLLDKISTRLRILFFVFNVLTILYFCVSTNTANKLQAGPGYKCSFMFCVGSTS